MTFKVIDKTTGEEPSSETIDRLAKIGGLMEMDIEGFAVTEDGELILLDECGRYTYVPQERFEVEVNPKKAWEEWFGNIREETKEEAESVNTYIKSISKPTGVNIDDF